MAEISRRVIAVMAAAALFLLGCGASSTATPRPTVAAATIVPATTSAPTVRPTSTRRPTYTPVPAARAPDYDDDTLGLLLQTAMSNQGYELHSAQIVDGRDAGGERVAILGWQMPSADTTPADVLKVAGVAAGAVHGLNTAVAGDIDKLLFTVGDTSGIATVLITIQMSDLALVDSGELTAEQFIGRWTITEL